MKTLRNHEASWTELVERLRSIFDDTDRPHQYIERVEGRIQFIYRPIKVREVEGKPLPQPRPQPRYLVEPAESEEDIRWAADLASRVYVEEIDRIPEPVMLDWYRTNPHGFSIVKSSGKPVGNLDILPLRPDALKEFKDGKLYERDITGDRLYTPGESSQITDLYIESFVCNNPLAVPRVLSEFKTLVRRICDPRKLQSIFAIAASPEGMNLLSDLGFKVIGTAQGHNLYSCTFDDLSAELGSVATIFNQLFEGRLHRMGKSSKLTGL